ncbi:MAG: helix-turn-helix transcriptional regulator [Candidatus Thiodiazotropha sp.]
MSAVMQQPLVFMNVKQVAEYLHLNEKKIYALVNEERIPATKITGKWLFPRELIDRWMLDSAHGGLMTNRLIIAGSDDPLLYRLIMNFAQDTGAHALISYTPTGTRLGLDLLQASRVDASGIHWGPKEESQTRHPALLRQYTQFRHWVLIRMFRREQGLILSPRLAERTPDPKILIDPSYRWVMRQSGAGAQRFLLEVLSHYGTSEDRLTRVTTALSEREAAATIAMGLADVAPGARSAATEYGLGFIPFGWESFDLALPRSIWFRRLFQDLLSRLRSPDSIEIAENLTGYDLSEAGDLIWGDE